MNALHHRTEGPDDAPAALFLHGFLGDGEDLAPLARALPVRATLVDLWGHGGSADVDPPERFEDALDALVGCMERLGERRFSVVGYSMGGRLALALAALRPDRVEAAVAISASPGIEDEAARAARRADDAVLAQRLRARGTPSFVEEWYAQPLFSSLRRHPRYEEVAARRARGRPEALARALVALGQGAMPSTWPALASLAPPTLVVVGALDARYVEIAREVARRAPRARVEIVEGAGHALHVEDEGALARLVGAHLRSARRVPSDPEDPHPGDPAATAESAERARTTDPATARGATT